MEALQEYGQTDYELRGASAKTGGYGTDLKEYRKLAKQVGGATKFNNLDVAQAINAGATLGIKKDEMKEIIPAASNLAQAFNSDITPALEMVKMHMNSYGLAGKDAQKVTDMIAVTSKNTAADLTRLTEGFKRVGATGKALNVPLETVYAMLGKINDSGLTGSSAGTALNEVFESLKDFKKRDKLEQLIGKVTDEKGNLQDVTSIMERLKGVTDKMGNADKAGVLKAIFGVQGGRGANILLNGSIEDLRNLQKEIKNSSGAAKRLSDFMMQGSAGAVETLMGTMSSTFAAVFDSLEPLLVPVAGLFMGIAEAIGMVAEKAPWLLQLVSVLGALVVGELVFQKLKASIGPFITGIKEAIASANSFKMVLYGLLAIGLVVIFNLFKQWQDYLQENADVSKVWESALQSLGAALGAIGDLIMAVIGAIFGFSTKSSDAKDKTKIWGMTADEVKQKLESFKKNVEKFTERIQQMSEWVDKNKEKVRVWGIVFLGLITAITIVKALSAAVMLLNGVLAMNPIVWIVAAIILGLTFLYLGLKWLYDNVTWFRDGVNGAWDFIKEHWVMILSYLGGFLIGGPIGIALVWLYNNVSWFRDGVNAIWDQIKEHWEMAVGAIAGLLLGGPIGAAIGAFIGWLVELYNKNETFRNAVNTVWNAAKKIISEACSVIAGAIGGVISVLGTAISRMAEFLAKSKTASQQKAIGAAFTPQPLTYQSASLGNLGHKAVGTNNFQAQGGGGMTAIDEHGDETIWLPNGSMVARNTTTLDMLNNLKSIKKNTRGGAKETGTVVTNNNKFVFNVTGTDETLQELKRELEKLGIV